MTHTIIISTVADQATAELIARRVLQQRLAACINIIPGVTSIYRWQGEIEKSSELILLIKSRADHIDAITETIRSLHPYQLPEIIALPLTAGLPAYFDWIDNQLDTAP
jgi:periplasmic divalent cation tolerance protein